MNRRVELLLGGFAVLVVLALLVLGRTSEASKVKAEVDHQVDLWNGGDIDGLYATLTVNAQQTCPLDVLKSLASSTSLGPDSDVALKNMDVRIQGGRAFVTGFVTVGGQLVGHIDDSDPAVYVKTDAGWMLDSLTQASAACQVLEAKGQFLPPG